MTYNRSFKAAPFNSNVSFMKNKKIIILALLALSATLYSFNNKDIDYEEANNKMPLIECDLNETVQKGIYGFKEGNDWYKSCFNNGPTLV